MKVSLFEMLQEKMKKRFHDILIYWDAPVLCKAARTTVRIR